MVATSPYSHHYFWPHGILIQHSQCMVMYNITTIKKCTNYIQTHKYQKPYCHFTLGIQSMVETKCTAVNLIETWFIKCLLIQTILEFCWYRSNSLVQAPLILSIILDIKLKLTIVMWSRAHDENTCLYPKYASQR